MSNTLSLSPADILATLLVERSLGSDPASLPLGEWPVYANVTPDTPDNVITVSDTTGTTEFRTMPDGATNEKYGFQVLVRGKDQPTAWGKIDQIQRELSQGVYYASFLAGGSEYTVKKIVNFGPLIRMGLERPASKRFLFSLNALVLISLGTLLPPPGTLQDPQGEYLQEAG